MEYKVVEVKWSRGGSFVGSPPISNKQPQLTKILNKFAQDGWSVLDIHHDVGDGLRFSIVTLVSSSTGSPDSSEGDGEGVAESEEPAHRASEAQSFLLTEGLYVGTDQGYTMFLRFGSDGRAIALTFAAPQTPEEGSKYLEWNRADAEVNTYSVTGQNFEISTSFFEIQGTVVSPTELDVSSKSNSSGDSTRARYVFVKVKDWS